MKNNFEFTQQEQEMIHDILQIIRDGYKDTYDTFIKKGEYDIAETYQHNINSLERIIKELRKHK